MTFLEKIKEISNRGEREYLRDYLNGELALDELLIEFDIEKCSSCENYELTEDLENELCEQCRGDK